MGSSSNPKAMPDGSLPPRTLFESPTDSWVPLPRGPHAPCLKRERVQVRVASRVVFPSATATKAWSDLKAGLGRRLTDTTRWARPRLARRRPPPPLSVSHTRTNTARAAPPRSPATKSAAGNQRTEGGLLLHLPVRERFVLRAIRQP